MLNISPTMGLILFDIFIIDINYMHMETLQMETKYGHNFVCTEVVSKNGNIYYRDGYQLWNEDKIVMDDKVQKFRESFLKKHHKHAPKQSKKIHNKSN